VTHALIPAAVETLPANPVPLPELEDAADAFTAAAKSAGTRKAYRQSLATFWTWCASVGRSPFPASPDTVRLYVVHLASVGRKLATIDRALAAISKAHRVKGLDSPTRSGLVGEVLAGMRRQLGAPQRQALAFEPVHVLRIVHGLPVTTRGLRDRALVTLGFCGGFRADDLARLVVEHVTDDGKGLVVNVPRSKTDQAGDGRLVGIPYQSDPDGCPVRAVRAWITAAGLTAGPLFRAVDRHGKVSPTAMHPNRIGKAVTRMARDAGLGDGFGGHSMRAGFCTTAARNGRGERAIMAVTGHKSADTLRRYIRRGTLWQDNAAAGLY
jgi:integrase